MSTETRTALPTGTWSADPVHSTVAFAVDYMAGTFQGSFSKFEARLADGALEGSAEVASVEVKDPNLEAHLQSPDFFDAERHPKLTFRSEDVSGSGEELTVSGEISMKGHTERIEAAAAATEPMGDPFGGERFGLKLEAKVDREKFGLTWNNPLPSGEPALSNEVTLIVDLQLVREED